MKKTINIFASIFSNIVLVCFGFLLPATLIKNLGSEMNGFLSTSTTIFGYVILIEAGLGTACLNSLYKPIAEKDDYLIGNILKSSRRKYVQVSLLYFFIGTVVALIFPLFVKTSYDYFTLFLIIFLEGLGGSILIVSTSTIKQFLLAKGEHYLEMLIHCIFYALGVVFRIIVLNFT